MSRVELIMKFVHENLKRFVITPKGIQKPRCKLTDGGSSLNAEHLCLSLRRDSSDLDRFIPLRSESWHNDEARALAKENIHIMRAELDDLWANLGFLTRFELKNLG
jgi:hypothetical protein